MTGKMVVVRREREIGGFGSIWWWSPQDELDVGVWERREGKGKYKRWLFMAALFMEVENVRGVTWRLGCGWTKSRVLLGHGRLEIPIRHLCWMLET